MTNDSDTPEKVVINAHGGMALVSRYVRTRDGAYSVLPALNWLALEADAAEAVRAQDGNLHASALYACPQGLAERAIWQAEGEMLTVMDAVELIRQRTGRKISIRTIRHAAHSGHIPGAVKVTRDWTFPENGLRFWLENRPRPGKPRRKPRPGFLNPERQA